MKQRLKDTTKSKGKQPKPEKKAPAAKQAKAPKAPKSKVKTPWYSVYGAVRPTLEYPDCTMVEMFERYAKANPKMIAYDFQGKKTTYKEAIEAVYECARALRSIGIRENDRVTICLPNMPQTITMFYAVNMVGAVANMIHPLSGESEIEFYLRDSNSVAAITLDQFYSKFVSVRTRVSLPTLIIASVKDALSPIIKLGYAATEGRKLPKMPKSGDFILWNDFIAGGMSAGSKVRVTRHAHDPAAILYSGGTTGTTKGIVLSNYNFNALAVQLIEMAQCFEPGMKMLAIMPMFHGFGLGISIHAMLVNGGRCLLIPRFTPQSYLQLIKTMKPNLIAGVPTLFEALLRIENVGKLDLSCLKGVFSGGDSLSVELKKRFDKFLKEHGATVEVREGYGTTECVTASCLTPYNMSREGSIGIPLPDMYFKIVKVGTENEVPYGTEGEICLSGPTVMIEYANQPKETASTLRVHKDGMKWVHTGDLGTMDEDGFVYFRQRIKRIIITSGYNVYPSTIENVLDAHKAVHMSCVIGVPDELKIQKVKAFVVLKPEYAASEGLKEEILAYCRREVAKYAAPYDIEFRQTLPTTLVGKVAYRILEAEEEAS